MLSRDPAFFISLIRRMYRPKAEDNAEETGSRDHGEDRDEHDDKRAAFAANAYRLLSEWQTVPGTLDDGSLDSGLLEGWIRDVRSELETSGHLDFGDSHIGRVLAHGPADADGARPCEPIRTLLERLQSQALEEGLSVELYNTRGPTSRGMFDGGDQERAIAADYAARAERFADRWPRTATVFRGLAESYEREARRMDEDAERRRKGFDS
jgi:hypothetical protein